jgi:hypothetical protein
MPRLLLDSSFMSALAIACLISGLSFSPAAQAEPDAAAPVAPGAPAVPAMTTPAVETVAPSAPAPRSAKPRSRKKGSAPREKETEGTEALDRFEADTVIKSQYHIDGKPLEVDPD